MAKHQVSCPRGDCKLKLVTIEVKDNEVTKITKHKSVVQLDLVVGDPLWRIGQLQVRHGTWYDDGVKHWISG